MLTTVLIRVKRALFTSPDRWASTTGYSKPFRRRVRDIFPGYAINGRTSIFIQGLPVHKPLPVNRLRGVYALKAHGVEGDNLVLFVS